jgi:hypothetical protein
MFAVVVPQYPSQRMRCSPGIRTMAVDLLCRNAAAHNMDYDPGGNTKILLFGEVEFTAAVRCRRALPAPAPNPGKR